VAALLSFDTEFSFPTPGVGGLMQFGAVAVPWDPETLTRLKGDGLAISLTFPLTDEHKVSDWVQENQAALLERCRALDASTYEPKVERLKGFLKRVREAYGEPVIPAGWCLGSDMGYLLHLLGEDNELVHFSAIDLKGIAMSLMHTYDPGDKELRAFLGTPAPENEHDALADAKGQLQMLLAAFKKIAPAASPSTTQST